MKKLSIVISFLGNAYHDSRVVNLTESLQEDGHFVKVISFDWETPNFKPITGNTSVQKLSKEKSSLFFYFKFIWLLIKGLLKTKADIYIAEDIYTLPFVYYIAKYRKAKVYYNSREFYAFLAGLRNKSVVQNIIRKIESAFITKVDLVLTTGEMDSEFLEEYYSIKNTLVIRNIPKLAIPTEDIDLREKLGISKESKILLYQGVLLEGRGLQIAIKSLKDLENCELVIIGDGPFRGKFEMIAEEFSISDKVHFLGKVPHKDLMNYTASADFGLCLIENISKSYYYALPNKLFEYIMSGLPIISSNLPQMKKIVEDYKIGKVVEIEKKENITQELNEIINDDSSVKSYKLNSREAAKELNWQREFAKVRSKLLDVT
ncbi:MAG: glycosyltransferase [Melioribacteraceae bacterium]|nr:glycosyltransferase [Melioribacteraceae bacterium]